MSSELASENYPLLLLALLSHRHTSSNHLYFSPEPGQQATTAAKTIRAARTEEVHHTALQQRKRPASSHLRSRETERSIATTYCVAPKAPRTRSATAQCDQELTTAPGTTEQHPADTPPPPPPAPFPRASAFFSLARSCCLCTFVPPTKLSNSRALIIPLHPPVNADLSLSDLLAPSSGGVAVL